MFLRQLKINNYKIFKDPQIISFPEKKKPAIFIGINGGGKTTILESIIGSLWEFHHKIQGKKVKLDSRFGKKNINILADENSIVKLTWNNGNKLIETGFEIRKTLDPETILSGKKEIESYIEILKGDVGFYKAEGTIPIVVYYPVERMILNPSLKTKRIEEINQFNAYDGSFEPSINFDNFFEWFKNTEDLENEIRLNKDATYSHKGLDSVRRAILFFLKDFSKIRVRRTQKPTLVAEKQGQEYEISQLSHGEKALIALVGDLARRLIIANPGKKNPLEGNGLVLIDEIDLHLHPTWQRTIMKQLTFTFPNIQFLCTTHSTLIINHLNKESIYVLDNGKCISLTEKYAGFNSYGADIEDILKLVQGTDQILPDDVNILFQELFQLIDDNDLANAKKIISELKVKIDANQPELKRAQTRIKFKELIKK